MSLPLRAVLFGAALSFSSAPALAAQSSPSGSDEVYTTAKDTALRLTLNDRVRLLPARQTPETEVAVFVDPRITYQEIRGFGGAITDAAAETYAGLEDEQRAELMRAYYDREDGIGYSLLRTPIHSCDFASQSHTYVEEGDAALATFDIAPDRELRLPMIADALRAAGEPIPTIASPWSAPAFMKGRENMLRGGKLLPRYRDACARYFVKFIEAYEEAGVPIFGVTVQNELLVKETG